MKTKVLHLDDDPEWREEVRNYLNKHGVVVTSVAHVRDADLACRKTRFRVIICDSRVDDHDHQDGARYAERLKSQRRSPRVVLLSNFQETTEVPWFDKGAWIDGERERLLAFIMGK